MEQARRLLAELRDADWNPRGVDQSLLRLPEQDHAKSWVDRDPARPSFLTDSFHPQYEEVAFYCDTFVEKKLTVVKGREGDLAMTGFFIVAWKDGRVNTVDIAEARLFPLPNENKVWIIVFPGMDEYDAGLKQYAPVIPNTRGPSGDGS